jgi:hypothetical protein
MVTIQGFKKIFDEYKNYSEQLHDMTVAEKRDFALLGGSRKTFLAIKEAILEVYDDLYAKLKPAGEMITIPKDFEISESAAKELGDKDSFRYMFDLWRVSEAIKLFKEKGTLRKRLGQEEEKRVYDNFYLWGFKIYDSPYNPFNIIKNCLETVMDTKNNEEKIQSLPAIPYEQKIRTSHLKKRETAVNWEKHFSLENVIILNKKLTSGKTVKEQYIEDRIKTLREPIDTFEFKHRMNNLARTCYEDKLKNDPSFSGYEVEYRFTERKVLEALTGKEFKNLSTYEKTKAKRMLFDNKDKAFTFFEKTADGQLKVVYWKLYDYNEYLLSNGSTELVLKFDLNGQDFRDKKSYIYSDNSDFSIVKQKEDEFWKWVEKEQKDDKNIAKLIKKIGVRLKRVKSNKIIQAAPIKAIHFLRQNFQSDRPFVLKKETFSMICGDIKNEAQSASLAGKNKPELAAAVMKLVRLMVLWILKKAGFVYYTKVDKGNVIIKPNFDYFTK